MLTKEENDIVTVFFYIYHLCEEFKVFCFSRNLNLKVFNFYFDNSCYCKFKARFSKRVIFAFEKKYFVKILSN